MSSGDEPAANKPSTSSLMKIKRKKGAFTSEMTIEDEAWRSYLESDSVGLTIASSDEDTAGALATLYEYYKVPVTKRQKISLNPNAPPPKVIKVEPDGGARLTSLRQINSLPAIVTTTPTGGITLSASRLTKPESPQSDPYGLIHSVENPEDLFHYTMEAPKSLKQKEHEPTMSYINKGQYYCITLRAGNDYQSSTTRVRSIVSVVFGDEKPEAEQLKHWKYWHSRQHTTKQRVIDIADYKESAMVANIHEFSHNAISFRWDTDKKAKIFIAVNCLSTDFSAQKGIKGMPLRLQIDTYSMDTAAWTREPMHRAAAQIKVFCDKGAERKIRDEERKSLKKRQKNEPYAMHNADIKSIVATGRKMDNVYFQTIHDTASLPVYFTPESSTSIADPMSYFQTRQRPSQIPVENDPFQFDKKNGEPTDERYVDDVGLIYTKHEPPSKILLYVKRETDSIFDALMLHSPTVNGLKEAIAEKFDLDYNKIGKVFKKQKRGIMVNMDDNIIAHYSHEDTFIIDFIQDEDGFIKISLVEYVVP